MRNQPGHKPKRRLKAKDTEPALIRGLVVSVLMLLGSLGFAWATDVKDQTIGLVVTIIVTLLPVVQALWTRYAVTPNAKVVARYSVSQDQVVLGEASSIQPNTPAEEY